MWKWGIAVLACLALALPSTAPGANPCPAPPSSGAELEADCKALAEDEARLAESERQLAEANAEQAQLASERASPPSLEVSLMSEHGRSFAEPGSTLIQSETLGRDLRVVVRGAGHTLTVTESSKGGSGFVVVPWTCVRPGAVYHVTVTAGTTAPLTRRGVFRGASVGWCNALRQRSEAAQLAARHRFESNCRTVGGKPVVIQTAGGRALVCRSQTGGIVLA